MNKRIVLIGGGGHAQVLLEIMEQTGLEPYAYLSPHKSISNTTLFDSMYHWDSDDDMLKLQPDDYILVNAIGSMPGECLRSKLGAKFSAAGFEFMTLISPMATVSKYAKLGSGVQILPSAVIQSGCSIGHNCIINTAAIIEHDSDIGERCHIAPGAVLCGGISLGENVHIGSNATVIQNIKISRDSIIGAGVTINKDIENSSIIYPARPHIRRL